MAEPRRLRNTARTAPAPEVLKTIDVELDDGTWRRVSATDAVDAQQRALRGEGLLLPPSTYEPPPVLQPGAPPQLTSNTPPLPASSRVPLPIPRRRPGQEGLGDRAIRYGVETVLPGIGRFAERAALPTAGSVGMGLAGQAIPGVRLLPRPVQEGIGSVLGTGANMALGIEPFDVEQLALSASMPAAAPLTARAAGQVPGFTRGATQLGRATGLAAEARAVPELLRGKITVDPGELFATARAMNPRLRLNATAATSARLLEREGEAVAGLRFGRVRQIAEELQEAAARVKSGEATELRLSPVLDDAGRPILREEIVRMTTERDGRIPLRALDTTRQRLGALIGVTHDGQEREAYRALYGAILTDIEEAAAQDGSEGARLLLKGIAEQRRSYSADSLADLIVTASGQPRPDGLVQINFGRILKTLENPRSTEAELLRDFLTRHPDEGKAVITLFQDMHRRNVKFLPPAGAMFGSGVTAGRFSLGTALTYGVNRLASTEVVPPHIGGAVYAAGVQGLARLAMTSAGRAYLKQLYQPVGTLNVTQIGLQVLGQGGRGPGAAFVRGPVADYVRPFFPTATEEEAP